MAGKQSTDVSSSGTGREASKFEQFRDYLTESKAEIKKVTWPTKKEARVTSVAVLILVVVMALFLGLVDLGLTKLVELILTAGA